MILNLMDKMAKKYKITDIEKIIRNKLTKTNDCAFKKAWIPKGWAAVPIDTFSKLITQEIINYLKKHD